MTNDERIRLLAYNIMDCVEVSAMSGGWLEIDLPAAIGLITEFLTERDATHAALVEAAANLVDDEQRRSDFPAQSLFDRVDVERLRKALKECE